MNKVLNVIIGVALALLIYSMSITFVGAPPVHAEPLASLFIQLLLIAVLVVSIALRLIFHILDTYETLPEDERNSVHSAGKVLFRFVLLRLKRHPKYGKVAKDAEKAIYG
jgi:hypothetical protein